MRRSTRLVFGGLALASLTAGGVLAGGFNVISPDGTPLAWDTSAGPIPVYTDGGPAFAYEADGVTPFMTIERADEITQFSLDQWNAVSTSTFQAGIVGTIASQTGITDVTNGNADQIYGVENGYGIWVVYDTDGAILQEFFGVSSGSVQGIAFPEIAMTDGTILEATALLNGRIARTGDRNGNNIAGVFTHELGHTLNLSHAQTNGHMAFFSQPSRPLYPGVPGCGVDPIFQWFNVGSGNPADRDQVETMYPFTSITSRIGQSMSFVTTPEDVASVSNLYPTDDYLASTGTITGTLRLKDGSTGYSGINIVARNVADPTGDALSVMTGHQTLGAFGPDGRFTIRNLTPGEEYLLYIEPILTGGFPVTPTGLVSVPEYWNTGEGRNPIADAPCTASPIVVEAGQTRVADLVFNGYVRGVDFRPVGPYLLTDLARDGASSLGFAGSNAFIWDRTKGVIPLDGVVGATGAMSADGTIAAVTADVDGNGIRGAAIWTEEGLTSLGHLGESECGSFSVDGPISSLPWAISDDGRTVVGQAYQDKNGDGFCGNQFVEDPEITGFVWTAETGMQELPVQGYSRTPRFVRAHAISGDGRVILGTEGLFHALAWVDGRLIDLSTLADSETALTVNGDGTRVALETDEGITLWDPTRPGDAAFEPLEGMEWCVDVDAMPFGVNLCDVIGPEAVQQALGPVPVAALDMTSDGRILIGRTGDFSTGFAGVFWTEATGWMTWERFFEGQGVAEATLVRFDQPVSISSKGTELVGGAVGSLFSWFVDLSRVFVCQDGRSIETDFPNGVFDRLAGGAELGRCEHIDPVKRRSPIVTSGRGLADVIGFGPSVSAGATNLP